MVTIQSLCSVYSYIFSVSEHTRLFLFIVKTKSHRHCHMSHRDNLCPVFVLVTWLNDLVQFFLLFQSFSFIMLFKFIPVSTILLIGQSPFFYLFIYVIFIFIFIFTFIYFWLKSKWYLIIGVATKCLWDGSRNKIPIGKGVINLMT